MATLSTLVNQNIVDPRKEGLPCFGIYGTADATSAFAMFRVFNSELSNITPATGSFSGTAATYVAGMSADAMYGYNGDFAILNDTVATNSSGSTSWYRSLHQHDQYPFGMRLTGSASGYMLGHSVHHPNDKITYGQFLINQVLPAGVRPRRFFKMTNGTFSEATNPRSMNVDKDSVLLSTYASVWTLTDGYGSAGYNERTKTLVVTHGNTTTSLQVNVFTSTVCLNQCTSLAEFFSNSTVKGFTLTRTYDVQSRYDRTVVVGDNGVVVIGFRVGNDLQGIRFNYKDAIPAAVAINTVSGTTSYGQASDSPCYTKMQLSWDGKWAFIYQPYYYYGCGVCGYVVSTEDPSRYFTVLNTDTSYGGAIIPYGTSGFMYQQPINTDSAGMSIQTWDFSHTNKYGTGNTRYDCASSGQVLNVINGAALPTTMVSSCIHGGFYSTCYPLIVTINWWPLNGKLTYEGAVK